MVLTPRIPPKIEHVTSPSPCHSAKFDKHQYVVATDNLACSPFLKEWRPSFQLFIKARNNLSMQNSNPKSDNPFS